MDQLRAIKMFLEVVDRGGFASAARSLDQSPAVVTRRVADLEHQLGTRLLNRSTRRVALTQAGAAYADRTRQLLIDMEEADAAAQAVTTRAHGPLRVQVPPAFAVHQLARHLPRFHAACPEVSLELMASGPVPGVDESADISIIFTGGLALDGDFIARPLARSELVLCAAPGYLDRRGRPSHPSDLESLDPLLAATANARRGISFHRGAFADTPAATVTVRPRPPVVSSMQFDAVFATAVAGLGVAGLPSFMVEQALLEGRLERVLEKWHVATFSLYVGLPSRQHVPAHTRAFSDFLLQTYGSQPEADPWLAAMGAVAPGIALGAPGPGFAMSQVPS